MNFVAPESLVFWTTLIFILFLFLIKKLAWKPILLAIREREKAINDSLELASQARKDTQNLVIDNERVLIETRAERDLIIKNACEIKDKIIYEARLEAKQLADTLIEQAKLKIQDEKQLAIIELKNQVALLSISIAEKIVREELSSESRQLNVIEDMLREVVLN